MEDSILKTTINRLIELHLEVEELKLKKNVALKELENISSEIDLSNPLNILKLDEVEEIYIYNSKYIEANNNDLTKFNEFRDCARSLINLLHKTLSNTQKTPLCFICEHEGENYKISMQRAILQEFDRMEIKIYSKINSKEHDGFVAVDFIK